MPREQRLRAHEERPPALARQDPRERRQDGSVSRLQRGSCHLAIEHRQPVAQDEDLDLLGVLTSEQQRNQLKPTSNDPVQERDDQQLATARSPRGWGPYPGECPPRSPAARLSGTHRRDKRGSIATTIYDDVARTEAAYVQGLLVMELTGLEPVTSWVRSRRSPN